MFWQSALSVFFGMVVADIMWAIYFISIAKNRKWIAGLSSGIIILVSSGVTVEYVHDPRLRWFAALGALVGTVIMMYVEENKEEILRFLKTKFGKSDGSWRNLFR